MDANDVARGIANPSGEGIAGMFPKKHDCFLLYLR